MLGNLVVVNTKNMTGAIVDDPIALAMELGFITVPVEFCAGIECYYFGATVHNLEAAKWAKFWLQKRDKRARAIGEYVPMPTLVKESRFTSKDCDRSFKAEVFRKEMLRRKKIKMIGGLYDHGLVASGWKR